MTIPVVCPHCDSRYQLQPDLVGKAMRCPNPDCREVFTVAAVEEPVAAVPPPPPPPVPAVTSAAVGDVLPLLDATLAAPLPYERVEQDDRPVPMYEGHTVRSRPPAPIAPPVFEAERVAAPPVPKAKPLPPLPTAKPLEGPREVQWTDAPKQADWAVAPPALFVADEDEPDPEVDEIFLRRKGRGRPFWMKVLIGMVSATVLTGLGIGGRVVWLELKKEEMLAAEAMDEFKKQGYPKAAELYDTLRGRYPESERSDEYRFFGDLSTLHVAAGAVTTRDNPADGIAKFTGFVAEHGQKPLAQPDEDGYGYDVFQAGAKLVDAVLGNAEDNLSRYRGDRNNRLDRLKAAEVAVEQARPILPAVDKFKIRDADVKGLDDARNKLNKLAGDCTRERLRLAVFAPYRDLPNDPSDQRIAEFGQELARNGFDRDDEGRTIIESAKAALRKLVMFVPDVRPPTPPPADTAAGFLFVAAPAGRPLPPPLPPAPDAVPQTFFAAARGVLYAFDADAGSLLWAAKADRRADVPLRVPVGDGGTELALVPTDAGGVPGLTARDVRTGRPFWYQPLEAPAAGRPVLIANRLYVPLADDAGTIIEIEARTGRREGFIQIRQRIGPGAAGRPGTSLLYVAAEARRVFVLDVRPTDADGNRQPLRCVQVLATGHPDLALRTPPVVAGPPGDGPGTRFLVLAQAEGAQATAVRSLPLPPVSTKPDETPPELVLGEAGRVTVAGHVWFPPAEVGERLAFVTDAGEFALLGTNLPGNQDAGLYKVPVLNPPPTDVARPVAGQVVAADEDTVWTLLRGRLQRLRVGFTPRAGLGVSAAGLPLPAGVPVQSPQRTADRETAFAVVRADESAGVRAVAFDPRDGRLKWERKLGAVAADPPVKLGTDAVLLVDEDGGAYRLPVSARPASDGAKPIDNGWTLAAPVPAATAPARMASTPDGKRVWVLIPEKGEKDTPQLRVRLFEDGPKGDVPVPLPDRLAGPAVAVGEGVVVPLADGFLYRYDPSAAKLVQGPQWRGDGAGGEATCYLSPADDDEFLATDGGRQVRRFRWAGPTDWKPTGGPWETREPIRFAPVQVKLGETGRRIFAADATAVWMWDADQPPGGDPVRRWRAGPDGQPGPVSAVGFAVASAGGEPLVTYVIDGKHPVCVSPGAEQPVWVGKRIGADDVLGLTASGGRLILTDQAGGVTVYDAATGAKLAPPTRPDADQIPRTPAVPFGPDRLLLPAWDGSAVLLSAPPAGA